MSNPALKIHNFYNFSLSVLNQINFARTHPEEYAEKLKDLQESVLASKDSNCLVIQKIPFLYNDLKGSLDNAINFLLNQPPLNGLKYNKEITKGCNYLLDTLIIHDGIKDEYADKYSLKVRLNKYGVPLGETFELIDYGMFDPEFIVINFILSDGDKSKYERSVIFNPNISEVGLASGILPSDKICTVINFAEAFYQFGQQISYEDKKKFANSMPTYSTKTINNYAGQAGDEYHMGKVTSNTKQDQDCIEQNTQEVRTTRRNSGDIFRMKKTQYVSHSNRGPKRRKKKVQKAFHDNLDTVKEEEEEEIEELEEEVYKTCIDDDNYGINPEVPLRRRRTLHEPDTLEQIPKEVIDDEMRFFEKEFDIKIPGHPLMGEEQDDELGGDNNKSKKKKKTTTTTQTEDYGNGFKTVTTTVTEEYVENEDGVETKHTKTHNRDVHDYPINEKDFDDDFYGKYGERTQNRNVKYYDEKEDVKQRENIKSNERHVYYESDNKNNNINNNNDKYNNKTNDNNTYSKYKYERNYEDINTKKDNIKNNNASNDINTDTKKNKQDDNTTISTTTEQTKKQENIVYTHPNKRQKIEEMKKTNKDNNDLESSSTSKKEDESKKSDTKINQVDKPDFQVSDDMFEDENNIEWPEGSVGMKVKQKIITDSNGEHVLLIKKTVTYEDGKVQTILEKKKIVPK